MTLYPHEVRVALGTDQLFPQTSALCEQVDVTCDMLAFADEFTLGFPFTREYWELTAPDSEVQVYVDDVRILTGFVDDQRKVTSREEGSSIRITGRDKGGRLVDESAPLVKYAGLGILDLAVPVVAPWFTTVSLSNARNRQLIRGRGRRLAAAAGEPPIITDRKAEKKVEPGESRADVLGHFLDEAGLLAWSSADGREFIVGKPNHDQAPQWRFLMAREGSARAGEANVELAEDGRSVAERYARIQVCGTSKGSSVSYGANVTKRTAVARNNPVIDDGTGLDFQRPKSLLLADNDITSAAAAKVRAEREMRLRDASARTLEITVPGYGQVLGGDPASRPAIYCFDTIARYEDEETEDVDDFLVTRLRFATDRQGGQWSAISMVPRGTELRAR